MKSLNPREILKQYVIAKKDKDGISGGSWIHKKILSRLKEWILSHKKKGITWKGSFDKYSRADKYKVRINECLTDLANECKEE